MAVTFGFYNSKNGDRTYNAEQMSSLFGGIIRDGVFEDYPAQGQHLKVEPATGFQMYIGPGRAWFENTWTDNDSPFVITMSPPEAVNDRIDVIALEINKTNNVDNNSDIYPYRVEGRTNKFVVVKGTPAPADQARRPTLRNGDGIYQHALAAVRLSTSHPNEIASYQLLVGVNNGTPFVMNAIENISAEDVIQSWTSALNAAINDLISGANTSIDAAIQNYFSQPGNIYQERLDELEQLLNEYMHDIDHKTDDMAARKHVWLIDKPVSMVANVAVTYSKSDQGGANVPHNIYPDFYREGRIQDYTMPKIGDVVIGSNGYYAVISQWTDFGGGYSMIISSTGKAIVDYSNEPFVIEFGGGHDRDGNDTSSYEPVYCSKTFTQIKSAYESGKQIEAYLSLWSQERGDGNSSYIYSETIKGVVEYHCNDDVLIEVVGTITCENSMGNHVYTHVYKIDAWSITEHVLRLA